MGRIIAIDPGSEESAWVEWGDGAPIPGECQKLSNRTFLDGLAMGAHSDCRVMVIEKAVCQKWSGSDVSKTMLYQGLFGGVWFSKYGLPVVYITPSKVRWVVCGSNKGNDSKIRSKLIEGWPDSYLEGYKYDIWQAGGLAWAFYEIMKLGQLNSLKIHKASREYIDENTIGGDYGRITRLLGM